MGEVVGPEALLRPPLEGGGGRQGREIVPLVGKKGQLVVQPQEAAGGQHPALDLPQLRVQADVPGLPPFVDGVKVPEGVHVDQHLRPGVGLAEGGKPPAVVIVAVGEHGGVHRRQVHPQGFRVGQEAVVGPHVEENLVAGRLDVQTQPVGGAETVLAGGVFQQGHDLHGWLLSRQTSSSRVRP